MISHILFALAVASAPPTSPETPQPATRISNRFVFHGHVVDEDSHPLAGASVRVVEPASETQTQTDENGDFALAIPHTPATIEVKTESQVRRFTIDATSAKTLSIALRTIGRTQVVRASTVGGTIERGGDLGLLGNRDLMQTPFSQTSYGGEFIKNLGATNLVQVLEVSPAVTRIGGNYDTNDELQIRGFEIDGSDITYDGLYGLSSYRPNQLAAIARVDLFRGPNALLYGVPPGGSIAGEINFVPKRATNAPVTVVSLEHSGDANEDGSLDVGRRFGPNAEFGVRTNVDFRSGETALTGNAQRQSTENIALDYRGRRARVFVDLTQDFANDAGALFAPFRLTPGLDVPKPPTNSTNPTTSSTYTKTSRLMGLIRAEYDLSASWTASIAYGAQKVDEAQLVDNDGPLIVDAQGTTMDSDSYRYAPSVDRSVQSFDAHIRGHIATGAVEHDVAFGAYRLHTHDDDYGEADPPGIGPNSNLYAFVPSPVFPNFAGQAGPNYTADGELSGIALSDTTAAFAQKLQVVVGGRLQSIGYQYDSGSGLNSYVRSALTPAFAILGRPSRYVSLYANAIEALQEAPQPPDEALNHNEVFPPARSRQYEFGAKINVHDTIATLALYQIEEPAGVLGADNVFRIDGSERHRGGELETYGSLARGFRVFGGVGFVDAKLEGTQGGIYDGKRPPNIPFYNFSLGTEADLPLRGLTLTAHAVTSGARLIDEDNLQRIAPWQRLDVGLRYVAHVDRREMTIRMNLTNALGNAYWESGNGNLISGPPRYATISTTYAF